MTKIDQPVVRDLMTTDVFVLNENDDLGFLDEAMAWQKIRHVPVVDTENKLKGLMTQRDFLRVAISDLAEIEPSEKSELYGRLQVKEIMTKEPSFVSPATSLEDASKIMFENKYGCLPVCDSGELIGIITESDFVKSFFEWEVEFKSENK
ncbi:MAG: CBS domain-containing protein [Bdellovibrionales bacterium]